MRLYYLVKVGEHHSLYFRPTHTFLAKIEDKKRLKEMFSMSLSEVIELVHRQAYILPKIQFGKVMLSMSEAEEWLKKAWEIQTEAFCKKMRLEIPEVTDEEIIKAVNAYKKTIEQEWNVGKKNSKVKLAKIKVIDLW